MSSPEKELNDFADWMERTFVPRVLLVAAGVASITAVVACYQVFGPRVALAVSLGLLPLLLIVATPVVANWRKQRPDNS